MALVNAVQQSSSTSSDLVVVHNTVGISRMNWAAPVLSSSYLYQPLWSGPGLDVITGFYCIIFTVWLIFMVCFFLAGERVIDATTEPH